MTNGLEIENLSVMYATAVAVRDASLLVPHASVVGLAGRNGAGKTSTLRAISGLVRRKGRVLLDGKELPALPEDVAARGVAHVPEGRGLFANLSVRDNFRIACTAVPHTERPFLPFLEESDVFRPLTRFLDRQAGTLSGGEQQLLAVARGLVVQPTVLLIDEMSLGLSPKALNSVLREVVRIGRLHSIGLLLVDQNVRALASVCDTLYLMREGVTRPLPPSDLLDVEKLYLDLD